MTHLLHTLRHRTHTYSTRRLATERRTDSTDHDRPSDRLLQFALGGAIPANLELGHGKIMSPRDRARLGLGTLEDQLSDGTARLLSRAQQPYRRVGSVCHSLPCRRDRLGQGKRTYGHLRLDLSDRARDVCSRLLHFGWKPWRSVIWFFGFLATTLMLAGCCCFETANRHILFIKRGKSALAQQPESPETRT